VSSVNDGESLKYLTLNRDLMVTYDNYTVFIFAFDHFELDLDP
jgi:hypothetical protein